MKMSALLFCVIFASVCMVNSHDHDFNNYIEILIQKFSSDGKLTRKQFKELSIDITSNKLPSSFSTNCENLLEDIRCITNSSSECLGYDDIFQTYSNGETMDLKSLGDAVPHLLFFAQESSCTEQPEIQHTEHTKPSSGQAWGYGIGFVSSIVVISNVGAFLGPCMKTQLFKRTLTFCVSLAVGTLAATGLLVLIPEALGLTEENSPVPNYNWKMTTVLGGIYFVFVMERLLKMIIRRKKTEPIEIDVKVPLKDKKENGGGDHGHSHIDAENLGNTNGGVATVAWILLAGDSIHKFVDGLSIGAAFTENIYTGISVSLAVLLEELPHELGDIAILLHAGLSIKRALLYNSLAAVVCYAGLIIGIIVGENTNANTWIFAFAGGLFVYIALVDMIPEMNEQAETSRKYGTESALQIFLFQNSGMIIGFTIVILLSVYGKYISV